MGLQVSFSMDPKCRKKTLYGHFRKYLDEVSRELVLHRGGKIIEGHMMSDIYTC